MQPLVEANMKHQLLSQVIQAQNSIIQVTAILLYKAKTNIPSAASNFFSQLVQHLSKWTKRHLTFPLSLSRAPIVTKDYPQVLGSNYCKVKLKFWIISLALSRSIMKTRISNSTYCISNNICTNCRQPKQLPQNKRLQL